MAIRQLVLTRGDSTETLHYVSLFTEVKNLVKAFLLPSEPWAKLHWGWWSSVSPFYRCSFLIGRRLMALRDTEPEPRIKSATVPYLPLPPVDAIDFPPPKFTKTVRARKGDTPVHSWSEKRSLPEAHRAIQASSEHYNPKCYNLAIELTYLVPQTSELWRYVQPH